MTVNVNDAKGSDTVSVLDENLSYPLPSARSLSAEIISRVSARWSRSLGVLVVDCEAVHIHGCERDGGLAPCICAPSFPSERRQLEDVRDMTRANIVRMAIAAADSWRIECEVAVKKLTSEITSVRAAEADHAAS